MAVDNHDPHPDCSRMPATSSRAAGAIWRYRLLRTSAPPRPSRTTLPGPPSRTSPPRLLMIVCPGAVTFIRAPDGRALPVDHGKWPDCDPHAGALLATALLPA